MGLQKWALVSALSELLMLADHALGRLLRIMTSNLSIVHRRSYKMTYHKRRLSTQWFCGLNGHETKVPGMGQNKLVRLRQYRRCVSTNT